jgi:hypothetical protein
METLRKTRYKKMKGQELIPQIRFVGFGKPEMTHKEIDKFDHVECWLPLIFDPKPSSEWVECFFKENGHAGGILKDRMMGIYEKDKSIVIRFNYSYMKEVRLGRELEMIRHLVGKGNDAYRIKKEKEKQEKIEKKQKDVELKANFKSFLSYLEEINKKLENPVDIDDIIINEEKDVKDRNTGTCPLCGARTLWLDYKIEHPSKRYKDMMDLIDSDGWNCTKCNYNSSGSGYVSRPMTDREKELYKHHETTKTSDWW